MESTGLQKSESPRTGPPKQVAITLLGTTDLHGHVYPIDYYADRPANWGLAKVATLVRKARAQHPNILLLDSGDTIQGTPLAYYAARRATSKPNPVIAAMNALGYAAMAVGNHEFNFGLEVLWKAKRESRFPWLAANLRQAYKSGPAYFPPSVIRNVADVRVGIVGLVTPGVQRWEIPANYHGYEFEPIVEAAKRVIPKVRKNVDLLVVIAHSGLESDAASGPDASAAFPGENAMEALAREVPGIDVILFGHTHRELPQKFINGVLLAQAKNWGQSLAEVEVVMEAEAGGGWRVASRQSATIPVTDQVPADPEILELGKRDEEATQAYLDTPVATSARELDGSAARYEDHPLVDLIHKAQMKYGSADVSLATMLYSRAHIPAGPVTVRQIASLYIYENILYTVEMTGAQLRQALEHAASYYPAWPFKPDEPLRLPGYNADSAEGVSYKIDLTRPVGQRIRDLSYKGRPLDAAEKFRVATNNYRYTGGGGYEVFRGLPILYRSPREIRELLIEYVSRLGAIPPEADHNWEIVPAEAAEALAREQRRRDQGQPASPAAPQFPARPKPLPILLPETSGTKVLTPRNVLVTFRPAQNFFLRGRSNAHRRNGSTGTVNGIRREEDFPHQRSGKAPRAPLEF